MGSFFVCNLWKQIHKHSYPAHHEQLEMCLDRTPSVVLLKGNTFALFLLDLVVLMMNSGLFSVNLFTPSSVLRSQIAAVPSRRVMLYFITCHLLKDMFVQTKLSWFVDEFVCDRRNWSDLCHHGCQHGPVTISDLHVEEPGRQNGTKWRPLSLYITNQTLIHSVWFR